MFLSLALALQTVPEQEIDRTRIDITEFSGTTSCHFKAVPGLTLRTGTGYWSGRWEVPADAATADQASLFLLYSAILDANRDKVSRLTAGQASIRRDQLGGKAAGSARLVLDDGGPELAPLPLGEKDGAYTISLRPALPRFDASSRALLTLLDAAGTPIITYIWNVAPVRRIHPLLNAVEWRCKDLTL